MSEAPVSPVASVSAAWAPVAALVLMALATLAAVVNSALDARAAGLPVRRAGGMVVGDVARLLRQRRRTTVAADTLLWRVGGAGLLVAALLMVTVVPLGHLTLLDSPVGVVWFNAMDVVAWAAVWLAGWGANSAHPLVGGYRFLALGLAYELPLMFALTAPAVASGSLRVSQIAAAQHGLWYVVQMPVAFIVVCAGVVGFSVWGPLAAPVSTDIAGGVLAELSGVDKLVFLAGRYAMLTAGSGFAVALFLGGGNGPVLPAWAWTLVKTAVVLAALVAVRRRLPLLRPERLAEVGWIVVLPVILVQLLVVTLIAIRRSTGG